jgi:hypothetical protein
MDQFISILVNVGISAFAAWIAYHYAVRQKRAEKRVELEVERDRALLQAYEKLWEVCKHVSNNRDTPYSIIYKAKGKTFFLCDNGKLFVAEINGFLSTKHGLYIGTELRRNLETLRSELMSLIKNDDCIGKEQVELVSPQKTDKLNQLINGIRIQLREDVGLSNPTTTIDKPETNTI